MREISLLILEIAMNSLDAGAKRICIELEFEADAVRARVEDDGKGMDEKALAEAFTAAPTHTKGRGLRQVKAEIEECGGRFEIASSKGAGTRVTMVFPKGAAAGDMGGSVAPLAGENADILLIVKRGEQIYVLIQND